jgi:hypothetical protein
MVYERWSRDQMKEAPHVLVAACGEAMSVDSTSRTCPGSDEPFEKATFYTKVGDQICGVGYYKK